MYRTILIEGITTENVEQKINEKVTEMEKESYQIKTMSFLGTEKAKNSFQRTLLFHNDIFTFLMVII